MAAWVLAAVVVASGLGWLYLLRNVSALRSGPRLADALPLEQLAAHATQPLLVVAVAFVPAGLVAGLVLAHVGRVGAPARVGGVAALAALLLVADAAVSAAVAQNERVAGRIVPTLGHSGIWAEVACVVIGTSLAAAAASGRARLGAGAAASAA